MKKEKQNKVEKSIRIRKWFLTINQDANCYSQVLDICKNINCNYSIMLHDKDNEEQPHYHVVINYTDAKTFQQVQKHFDGAHIEDVKFMYKVCRYLLHLDDPEKYQYPITELLTNCNEVEYYIEQEDFIKLEQESLLENIQNGKVYNMTSCIQVYGMRQVNLYRNLIQELLKESKVLNPEQKLFNMGYEMGEEVAQNRANEVIGALEQNIEELESLIKLKQREIDELKSKLN